MSTLDNVARRMGKYEGKGVDHTGQPFTAELDVTQVVLGRGVAFSFVVTGAAGLVQYRQYALMARGENGRLALLSLDDQGPRLHLLELRREGSEEGSMHSFVFGLGDPSDRLIFRLEIAVDLYPGDELGYRFFWGLPGGDFAPRSAARLRKY